MSRLVLLVASPRVAPGMLTVDAWDVLREGIVLAAAPEAHPQRDALRAAGVAVAPHPSSARELLALAAGSQRPVVWLVQPSASDAPSTHDEDAALTRALATEAVNAAEAGRSVPEVEVLLGSYDLPGSRLLDLVAVMDRLRSPGGCPWDAKQTHQSLATYLLEETYETLEAIETQDDVHLREELGDLLLQVVFHARIAEERVASEPWSVDDVAEGIVEKLVRRHPHVFAVEQRRDERGTSGDRSATGGTALPSLESLDRIWEEQKAAEKARTSALDGVPMGQPALSLASKLLHRVEKAGVEVAVPPLETDGDVGDLLLAVVALARSRGEDAEQALRAAVRRWTDAVRAAEAERSR